MQRILPLPSDAISGIQSSKQITSLQGVVLSLLENSLDASSSKVEISIDFRRGCCTVEDNGAGIPATEFVQSGGLGKLYHTSKQFMKDAHGSNGTHLASLGTLSLLSITSRCQGSRDSAAIAIHQGKVIARQIPAPQIDELILSPSNGTRVTVRDLFGNMPVRVKQRAMSTESSLDDAKAWQELKHGVVALLLAWPKPCSVKIRDLNDEKRKIQMSGQHPSVSQTLTERSLNQLAGATAKFELKDALPIVIQAGLAPNDNRTKWVPLSAASSMMSVKGSICLEPAPTKACQFISLGVHPCERQDGYADLYDTVNHIFSNSSFGAIEDDVVDLDDEEKDRRAKDRRYKQDGFTRKQIQGRKGVDRWPMFVLQLKFREQTRRSERLSERGLKAIIDILDAAVRQWLEVHHFRLRRKRQKKADEHYGGPVIVRSTSHSGRSSPATTIPDGKRTVGLEIESTSKQRKVLDSSGRMPKNEQNPYAPARPMIADFSSWSRIKSGRQAFYDEIWDERKPQTAPESRIGTEVAPVQTKRTPFVVPVLESGQLSMTNQPIGAKCLSDKILSPHSGVQTLANSERAGSSDEFGSVDDVAIIIAADEAALDAGKDLTNDIIVEWTDLGTNKSYMVNSRTGVALPHRTNSQHTGSGTLTSDGTPQRDPAAINTSLTSAGLPLTLSKRPSTAKRDGEMWLPGFLKEWQNPVFTRQVEEPIPIASFERPGVDVGEATNKCCTHQFDTKRFEQMGQSGMRKLSKTSLRNAKVIRQVDRKFILCKVREADNEVLVLVDQHAASERVILEDLLAELCEPVDEVTIQTTGSRVRTIALEKPLHFQVSATEFELFRDHSSHFADWGILYDLRQQTEDLSASQVRQPKQEHIIVVKALPPGIVERCSLFPKLLIELLRSELYTFPTLDKGNARSNHPDTDYTNALTGPADETVSHAWLTRIGSCPKGILDMLNSRACRSAIMFNDELSDTQCEELLDDLSKCAFPFMCAHGRVSMVPLAELGWVGGPHNRDLDLGGAIDDSETTPFSKAFKRWRSIDTIGQANANPFE